MNVDIKFIQREGKRKTNTSQFVPRASKEMKDNLKEYRQLESLFQPVFEWQKAKVKISII
jgi:hypothetical protein